jgi:hypothetical protein
MSDENVTVSDGTEQPSNETTVSKSQEDFVSKKAYEEVTKDMHKFKSRYKEASAAKAEYEAKLKAIEEEKLKEQENYKALSEKYQQELEELKHSVQTEKQRNEEIIRKNALKQELGGLVKDQYLSLIDLNEIEINENGLPDKDSLLAVANKFREEHGVLIQSTKGGNPTSAPPSADGVRHQEKTLDQMSVEEKLQYLKSMKQ